MNHLKKIGKVFLYVGSAIALVKLAKLLGLEIENADMYLMAIINIAMVSIKELFEASKKEK